jgi:hypothetical protein
MTRDLPDWFWEMDELVRTKLASKGGVERQGKTRGAKWAVAV